MTRVTDAELERMTAMCASDVTDDRRALLGDAIRAELLELRKVADAARIEMIREFVAVAYDAGADGIHDRSAADATDRIVAAICALPTEAK